MMCYMKYAKNIIASFNYLAFPPDGLLTSEETKHDVELNPHIIAPDPFSSDDCFDVYSAVHPYLLTKSEEVNTMNTGEDETSSGLNGRLRPRKSNVPGLQSNKTTRKSDGKLSYEKSKRTHTPSKTSCNKPDDLANKSETTPSPQFLCPYCDGRFASKQTLSKHTRRMHLSTSKQDSFMGCLFCNNAEVDGSDIIRHMVDSHPNQYFACLDCHTRFPSTTELAEHKHNVCEKQKLSYRSKLRQKASSGLSKRSQKTLNIEGKNDFQSDGKGFPDRHSFNGVVIACELKPSHVHDEADIEDNITTNLILPPSKSLGNNAIVEKNAVIVLDDIQWNKRIPPNFSFHNSDADQILTRLGVVHRSPRVGESTRKEWFKTIDDVSQKFEKCFDTSFYSKVASNVQENLAKYLDGSFNFNPDPDSTIKTRKSKNSVVINTAEGFPILLAAEQYSRNVFDGYMPRAVAPKHKWKWDTLEIDKNPPNPDQIKRDSHTNNCIITLVSSLDISTQLCMRRKFEDKFGNSLSDKKTEKQNVIKELKEILESREIPASSSQVVKYASKPAMTGGIADFPLSLGLMPSAPRFSTPSAVLSGEWTRPRCYVCSACGAQTRDSRALASHVSTQHPNAQVQHYEIVGEELLNADILKHLYVPQKQICSRTRPPRGFRECTKCTKSVTFEDLHQHMLDCAGDTPTVRRKCRYRPFGVRRRRPRLPDNTIRKKMRKDIRNRQTRQKNLMRQRPKIRSEVGDAETIRKMLADLPAKRHRVMINPINSILRPRRKLDKQRNKLMMKKRSSEDRPNKKQRSDKEINVVAPIESTSVIEKRPVDTSHRNDAENKHQKLKSKRSASKNDRPDESTVKRKSVVNRPKRNIKSKKQQISTDKADPISYPMLCASTVKTEQLSIDNVPQRIDVNGAPHNAREHSNRSGSNNRDNQQPGCSGQNGNSNNSCAHTQNVPLKHSIARLTADSETHDKSVQFHQMFLVQQECNNINQHVPTGHQLLFENEAAVTRLDKPPLYVNSKVPLDPGSYQKNKLNKPRKGLNDCIAMLKNKLVDPAPAPGTGHISVQCGNDEPLYPDRVVTRQRLASTENKNRLIQTILEDQPRDGPNRENKTHSQNKELQLPSNQSRREVSRESRNLPESRRRLETNREIQTPSETRTTRESTHEIQTTLESQPRGNSIHEVQAPENQPICYSVRDIQTPLENQSRCEFLRDIQTHENQPRSDYIHKIQTSENQPKSDSHREMETSPETPIRRECTRDFQRALESRPSGDSIHEIQTLENQTRCDSLREIQTHPGNKSRYDSLRAIKTPENQSRRDFIREIQIPPENRLKRDSIHATQTSAKTRSRRDSIREIKTSPQTRSKRNSTREIQTHENRHRRELQTLENEPGCDIIHETGTVQNLPTSESIQDIQTLENRSRCDLICKVQTPENQSRHNSIHEVQMISESRSRHNSTRDRSLETNQENNIFQQSLIEMAERPKSHEKCIQLQPVSDLYQQSQTKFYSDATKRDQMPVEGHHELVRHNLQENQLPKSTVDIIPQVGGIVSQNSDTSVNAFTHQHTSNIITHYDSLLHPEGIEINTCKQKTMDSNMQPDVSKENIALPCERNLNQQNLTAMYSQRDLTRLESAIHTSITISNRHSESCVQSNLSTSKKPEDYQEKGINKSVDINHGNSNRKSSIEMYSERDFTDISSDIPPAHSNTNVESILSAPLDLSGKIPPTGKSHNQSKPESYFLTNYDNYETLDLSNKCADKMRLNSTIHVISNDIVDLRVKTSSQMLPRESNKATMCTRENTNEIDNVTDLSLKRRQDDVSPTDLSVKGKSNDLTEIEDTTFVQDLSGQKHKIPEGDNILPEKTVNIDPVTDLSERRAKDKPVVQTCVPVTEIKEKIQNAVSTDLSSSDVIECPTDTSEKVNFVRQISNTTQSVLVESTPKKVNEQKNDHEKSLCNIIQTKLIDKSSGQLQKPVYDPTLKIPQYKIRASVSGTALGLTDVVDVRTPNETVYFPPTTLHEIRSVSRASQDSVIIPFSTTSLNISLPTVTGNIPVYTLPSPMTITPGNKTECTTPVYTLANACITVTKIETSTSVTLVNTLLSIPGTTIASTTSVYTLAGTTIGAPTNYGAMPNSSFPFVPPTFSNYVVPTNDTVGDVISTIEKDIPVTVAAVTTASVIREVEEEEISMRSSSSNIIDQDPETARKIAMLPKELVEILGTMPIDHRNQLLNVLPQYVSTSISVPISQRQTSHTLTNASTSLSESASSPVTSYKQTVLPTTTDTNSVKMSDFQQTSSLNIALSSQISYSSTKPIGLPDGDEIHATKSVMPPPPPPPLSSPIKPQTEPNAVKSSPSCISLISTDDSQTEVLNVDTKKCPIDQFTDEITNISLNDGCDNITNKVIDLTEDENTSKDDSVKVPENLSQSIALSVQETQSLTLPATTVVKPSRHKRNHDQTASLRAVRIKAPSERHKSTLTENNFPNKDSSEQPLISDIKINKLDDQEGDKLLDKNESLAIQQAEITSTQQNSKNVATDSKFPAVISPTDRNLSTEDLNACELRRSSSQTADFAIKIDKHQQSGLGNISNKPGVVTSSITANEISHTKSKNLVTQNHDSNISNDNLLKTSTVSQMMSENTGMMKETVLSFHNDTIQNVTDSTWLELPVQSSTPEQKSGENQPSNVFLENKSVKNNFEEEDSDDDISLAVIVKQKQRDSKTVLEIDVNLNENLNESVINTSRNKKKKTVNKIKKVNKKIKMKETNESYQKNSIVTAKKGNLTIADVMTPELNTHESNKYSKDVVEEEKPMDKVNNNPKKKTNKCRNLSRGYTSAKPEQKLDIEKNLKYGSDTNKENDNATCAVVTYKTCEDINNMKPTEQDINQENEILINDVNENLSKNGTELIEEDNFKETSTDLLIAENNGDAKDFVTDTEETKQNLNNCITTDEHDVFVNRDEKVSNFNLSYIHDKTDRIKEKMHNERDPYDTSELNETQDTTISQASNTETEEVNLESKSNSENRSNRKSGRTKKVKNTSLNNDLMEMEATTVTPLRRSRRGKSLFVSNAADENDISVESLLEQKTPLTKKQLIFSKLLLDEEASTKPRPDLIQEEDSGLKIDIGIFSSSVNSRSLNISQSTNDESNQEANLDKNKSGKRKKSPQPKQKFKKMKSLDGPTTDENNTHERVNLGLLHTDTKEIHENTILLKSLAFTETHIDKRISNQAMPSQGEAKTGDRSVPNGVEEAIVSKNMDEKCGKFLFSAVKRKVKDLPTVIENSESPKLKKSKGNTKDKYDLSSDIFVEESKKEESNNKLKDNLSMNSESRTTCYNTPIAARRSRSKSVVVKSSNADFYDPYNIDFDDVIEKTEPFYKKGRTTEENANNNYKIKVSNAPKDTAKDIQNTHTSEASIIKTTEMSKSIEDCRISMDLNIEFDKAAFSDSDESSKSDVPLQKYVEEKEKKILEIEQNMPEKEIECDMEIEQSEQSHEKQNTKGNKNSRRTLAVCNNVESVSAQSETEEQLRSEQFMESFGFFSERKPRKSNLLATKKISETFHIIANESDDIYFGYKERTTKRLQNENRKSIEAESEPKVTHSPSKKVIKRGRKKKNSTKTTPCYCYICKKEFRRPDNYLRHQMTLLHISKLSEIEMKVKTVPVHEEPNYLIAYKQHLDRLKILTDKYAKRKKNSKSAPKFTLPTLEEILADVNKTVREQQLKQRELSRDEALFLDCCEMLKESHKSEVTTTEPPRSNKEINNFECPPHTSVSGLDLIEKVIRDVKCDSKSDGDVDSITAKNILESEEVRNLENDLISGLKEAACSSSLNMNKVEYQHATNEEGNHLQDSIVEDLSSVNTAESQYEHLEGFHTADESGTNRVKKQPEIKEKMYPDILENIDMFEDKFDKIKRKCRSQAAAAKQIQTIVEPSTSHKGRKKSDKKRGKRSSKKNLQNTVLTKGALKGFDGIKVSIPTSDINMSAIVPSIDSLSKKKKKRNLKKKRDKKDSESSGKYDYEHRSKDSTVPQKKVDVYEFMDNEDAELFEFRPSTLMERFKNITKQETPSTSKTITMTDQAEMSSVSGSDGDDFVYMSDDYVCSDIETENSLMSCELGNVKLSGDLKKTSSPLKRKDVVEKNAVMGKIFKNNAVRTEKKSLKGKEPVKPKANFDQLFDSLLEDEPTSSVLEHDETLSPKKNPSLSPINTDASYTKYDMHSVNRYDCRSPSGDDIDDILLSKYKTPPPENKMSSSSSSSKRRKLSSPKEHSVELLKTHDNLSSKYDDLIDYGPSTSKKYDDLSSTINYGPGTSKKSEVISSKDYKGSLPKIYDGNSSRKVDIEVSKEYDIASPVYDTSPSGKYKVVSSERDSPTKKQDSRDKPREESTCWKSPEEGAGCSFDFNVETFDPSSVADEAGVARQRARRKCTVGKQNVLAETWSSESEPDGAPPRPHSTESCTAGGARRRRGRKKEGHQATTRRARHSLSKKRDGESRVSHSNNRSASSGGGEESASAASGGAGEPAAAGGGDSVVKGPAYYWSSDGDEEQQEPQPQHGWIVGDSHKKLVTMLAHAKGRKRNNDDTRNLVE